MVYQGSHVLSFLCDFIGLPIDQLNLVFVQLIALISGLFFRAYVKPCPQNTLKRHLIAILWGFLLGNFCFGGQMWHLIFQYFVSYGLLIFCPRKYVHLAVFIFCMGYLSGLHIYRLVYDYGNYTIDITCPFMISTQKITAFAFAYYDGMLNDDKLSADQKSQAIKDLPHIIEYLSYLLNFQGVIVGPLSFYQDYIDFITGNNILKHKIPLLKKFITLSIVSIVFFKITNNYPIQMNVDDDIIEKSLGYRIYFLYVTTSSTRAKYYFAWILAELVNNASGFGFNGYDANGNEKWDLLTNVRILDLELATSMKTVFDNWNIQTQVWLKRICFDRLPTLKTLGVFVLSAIWHGFYPGYYFTFVTAAFVVYAGRGIRRKIRPFFQTNTALKYIYEALTWVGTALTLSYSVAPFEIIDFWSCIKYYNSWYWWLNIVTLICTIALPGGSKKKHTKVLKVEGENQVKIDDTTMEKKD